MDQSKERTKRSEYPLQIHRRSCNCNARSSAFLRLFSFNFTITIGFELNLVFFSFSVEYYFFVRCLFVFRSLSANFSVFSSTKPEQQQQERRYNSKIVVTSVQVLMRPTSHSVPQLHNRHIQHDKHIKWNNLWYAAIALLHITTQKLIYV